MHAPCLCLLASKAAKAVMASMCARTHVYKAYMIENTGFVIVLPQHETAATAVQATARCGRPTMIRVVCAAACAEHG